MKKNIHCTNCNHRFEYTINNMDELKSITCPKCRQKITKKDNYNNIKMVAPAGIEPATQGFSVPCSTD